MKKDLVIIGKGPAGISCGIYAQRDAIDNIIIAKDYGNMRETIIENYYGVREEIECRDLALIGEEQYINLGGEILQDEVQDIIPLEFIESEEKKEGYKFKLILKSGKEIFSKYIFAGIGLPRVTLPNVGIEKYEGKGVSYCATCDGFIFRGKDVAVIGSDSHALKEARQLKNLASKVTIITDGRVLDEEMKKAKKEQEFEIVDGKVISFNGEEVLENILAEGFDGLTTIKVSGAFVALEFGTTEISAKLGVKMNGGEIIIDEKCETNVKGLYAGGDVTKGPKQIAKAVYDGMIAALSISESLRGI